MHSFLLCIFFMSFILAIPAVAISELGRSTPIARLTDLSMGCSYILDHVHGHQRGVRQLVFLNVLYYIVRKSHLVKPQRSWSPDLECDSQRYRMLVARVVTL